MKVNFYELDEIKNEDLKYAVISTFYKGKNVLVRHKERETWELPGGHREYNENIEDTAKRELFEETGAEVFNIKHICNYSVECDGEESFGRLCLCDVSKFGELPNMEIKEVRMFDELPENLTYREIQPFLQEKILKYKEIFFR